MRAGVNTSTHTRSHRCSVNTALVHGDTSEMARASAFHVNQDAASLPKCTGAGCYRAGRAGTGGEELFFSAISNARRPLLRVTPEPVARDGAGAEKPPFERRSRLCLRRMHQRLFGTQAPGKSIRTRSDAEIACVCVRFLCACASSACWQRVLRLHRKRAVSAPRLRITCLHMVHALLSRCRAFKTVQTALSSP